MSHSFSHSTSNSTTPPPPAPASGVAPEAMVWFDIDNCLYGRSSRISELMQDRIRAYFRSLGLSEEEAGELHHQYYKSYGLAIRGLVAHHQVDPLDYDTKCDASLPLESVLKPDPKLRKLLADIDRSKVRVWALTNAYKTHAHRVLDILGVADLIEHVVYCDYARPNFPCKPEVQFYREAMEISGIADPSKHYFVDDSSQNVVAAQKLGWNAVYFLEHDAEQVEGQDVEEDRWKRQSAVGDAPTIGDIHQLRQVWAPLFKQGAAGEGGGIDG